MDERWERERDTPAGRLAASIRRSGASDNDVNAEMARKGWYWWMEHQGWRQTREPGSRPNLTVVK